jgi:membrane protein implicated in regulation of membrane protease activity
MQHNEGPSPQQAIHGKQIASGSSWFGRLVAGIIGVAVLVGAALLSVVLLAVLFGIGAVVIAFLWWKTRALRRQARTFGDDGRTVDVDMVFKDSAGDDPRKG